MPDCKKRGSMRQILRFQKENFANIWKKKSENFLPKYTASWWNHLVTSSPNSSASLRGLRQCCYIHVLGLQHKHQILQSRLSGPGLAAPRRRMCLRALTAYIHRFTAHSAAARDGESQHCPDSQQYRGRNCRQSYRWRTGWGIKILRRADLPDYKASAGLRTAQYLLGEGYQLWK